MTKRKLMTILITGFSAHMIIGACAYAQEPVVTDDERTISEEYVFLADLEQKMSTINILRADFVQEKELAVFNNKITMNGVLCFSRPNLFAWHTREPLAYSMVIKDDAIWQWDEDTDAVQKLPILSNPALQTMVVRMKEWFTGNFTAFIEDYEFSIESREPPILVFTPRMKSVAAKILAKVMVEFKSDERYIYRIRIDEKSGDSTVLTFTDVVINQAISPELWDVGLHAR